MSERAAVTIRQQAREIEKLELERDQWRTRAGAAERRVEDLETTLMQIVGRVADKMDLHVKTQAKIKRADKDGY